MPLLVTVARYRAITGDTATDAPTVTARIEEAQGLLEEALDRPLEEAERTEAMRPTRDGWLWPRATPIVAADGWTVDGLGLRGSGPFDVLAWPEPAGTVMVTYTGGWVERTANPAAANRLPDHVERDLAFATQALAPVDVGVVVPAGARSVSVGDVAVTFDTPPDGRPRNDSPQWSRRTFAYRYRPVRGARP